MSLFSSKDVRDVLSEPEPLISLMSASYRHRPPARVLSRKDELRSLVYSSFPVPAACASICSSVQHNLAVLFAVLPQSTPEPNSSLDT